MLTSSDLLIETKRLLNRQVVGISMTTTLAGDTLINVNDGTGDVTTLRATDEQLRLPIGEFSRRLLAPALEVTCPT